MRSIETLMAEGREQPKRKRRDRFAPVLTALLEDLRAKVKPGKAGAGDAQVLRLATEELRLLKAVPRAWLRGPLGYTTVMRAVDRLLGARR